MTMLGLLFGVVCLVGFWKVASSHGRGWGYRRRRGWHRNGLYSLFERLDTSPGQEKAIRAVLGELFDSLAQARRGVSALRAEVGKAFRDEAFGARDAADAFSRHADLARGIQDAVASTLAKVHEVLDPDQRNKLARWLESSGRARWV